MSEKPETKTNAMKLRNIISEYGYRKQVLFPNGRVIHEDDRLCLQEDYDNLVKQREVIAWEKDGKIAELQDKITEAHEILDEIFGADGEEPDTLSCAMSYLKRLHVVKKMSEECQDSLAINARVYFLCTRHKGHTGKHVFKGTDDKRKFKVVWDNPNCSMGDLNLYLVSGKPCVEKRRIVKTGSFCAVRPESSVRIKDSEASK